MDALALSVEEQRQEAVYEFDKRLLVVFYKGATYQSFASEKEGRPIFKEEDYIKIFTPGDKNTVIDRPVSEIDKKRFADRYAKYNSGNQDQYGTGTPLKVWPRITVAQVAEMGALNIYTVEQLAEVPDTLAQRIMGSHELRRQAKSFLDSNSAESKLVSENEANKKRIAELEESVKALLAAAKPAAPAKA